MPANTYYPYPSANPGNPAQARRNVTRFAEASYAADADVRRATELARWLDQKFIDPIAGFLLPGVGDLVGSAAGVYTVYVAFRRRLPPILIARMLINLAIDAALGAIPIVGDVFDLFFRANQRNARLLNDRYVTRKSTAGDWAVVVLAAVVCVSALLLPIFLAVKLIQAIF